MEGQRLVDGRALLRRAHREGEGGGGEVGVQNVRRRRLRAGQVRALRPHSVTRARPLPRRTARPLRRAGAADGRHLEP
eukprot:2915751-Pyramimonas_sp.AAC.1